jgi:hypothetical protein
MSTGTTSTACAVTPSETLGPYPSLTDMMRSIAQETATVAQGSGGYTAAFTVTVNA